MRGYAPDCGGRVQARLVRPIYSRAQLSTHSDRAVSDLCPIDVESTVEAMGDGYRGMPATGQP